jgi:hypothetical protein
MNQSIEWMDGTNGGMMLLPRRFAFWQQKNRSFAASLLPCHLPVPHSNGILYTFDVIRSKNIAHGPARAVWNPRVFS